MPATYENIATTTVGTATTTVTFSSIAANWTDLIVVCTPKGTAADYLKIRLNGDTGNNYSMTNVFGNGTTPSSGRTTNGEYIDTFLSTDTHAVFQIHFMNYANTTTNKTVLVRGSDNPRVGAAVGLWRSTAAINSISLLMFGSNTFVTGSTFTLYGIKAA